MYVSDYPGLNLIHISGEINNLKSKYNLLTSKTNYSNIVFFPNSLFDRVFLLYEFDFQNFLGCAIGVLN